MKSGRKMPPRSTAAPRGRPASSKPARPSAGRRPPPIRDVRSPKDTARWVFGIHACEEVLKVRPKQIREAWIRSDYQSSQNLREIADSLQHHRVAIKPQAVGQLDTLGSGHQGVALAVMQTPELDWKSLESPGKKIILALDGIEDPHNLGAMLRTAWLTGVAGLIILEDRAVDLTPTVCKIASGGAEHIPVDKHVNLASALEELKKLGFWIYGLSEKGKNLPWQFKLPEKVVWVVGSEGSGLRVPTERACDELVRLPQVSSGSSYNASIAMTMALAETCRQFGIPD
jgi:23S rRNA (guanosine2251-2'-O)-methyltransferase